MPKKSPTDPFKALHKLPLFMVRNWFGGQAYISGELIMLAHFQDNRKNSAWNGILVATSKQHHPSLLTEFKFLKPHPVLGKWLYLAHKSPNFAVKLKKIIAACLKLDPRLGILRGEKHKARLLKGDQIAIHQARNLGPKSAMALAQIGVKTLAQLKDHGWEQTLENLWQHDPKYCNLNMARALIGAIDNVDWREISKNDLVRAKNQIKNLKRKL